MQIVENSFHLYPSACTLLDRTQISHKPRKVEYGGQSRKTEMIKKMEEAFSKERPWS